MTTMQTRQSSIPSSSRLSNPDSPRGREGLRRAGWGARGTAILAAMAVIGLLGMPGRAEPTNYWTNSLGGSWNDAGNWTNTAGAQEVPGVSNMTILPQIGGNGYTVNYTNPMSAASIQALQMNDLGSGYTNVLNINAAGFVVDPTTGGYAGWASVFMGARNEINVNNGGVLTVTNWGQPFYVHPTGPAALNINGGTVGMYFTSPWGYLRVDGVLNMNSGTLTATYIGIFAVSGTINFRGGVINTERLALGGNNSLGTMIMTNGTLILSGGRNEIGGNAGGVMGLGPGTMTVSGGSVTNSGSLEIGDFTNGTVNVSGGSWAQLSAGGVRLGLGGGIGTLNISGTAFFNSVGFLLGDDMTAGTYGALNISNGVFQATNGTATALLNVKQGALTLSGGTVRVDKLILQDNVLTNTLKFVATPGNTNMGVVNVVGALTISNAATARLVVDMSQYTEWRAGVTSVLLVTYGTLTTPFSSGNIEVTPPPMLPMRITATVDQTGGRIQVNLRVPKGTVVSGR